MSGTLLRAIEYRFARRYVLSISPKTRNSSAKALLAANCSRGLEFSSPELARKFEMDRSNFLVNCSLNRMRKINIRTKSGCRKRQASYRFINILYLELLAALAIITEDAESIGFAFS